MERKIFNPQDWFNRPILLQKVSEQQTFNTNSKIDQVETIIRSIEVNKIDITSRYSDWVNIGFAFSSEFGEKGRNLFHRISKFYPGYSVIECDKQFDNCLKSRGNGVTLKTFFYLANNFDIDFNFPQIGKEDLRPLKCEKLNSSQYDIFQTKNEGSIEMPTFPNSLFPQLPEFLKRVVAKATSNEEKDILLLGSLIAISACFPTVSGIYDGKRVFSNLFLFITAPASAGKGRLMHCRQLVNPIHKELQEQTKRQKLIYELKLAEYNARKRRKHECLEKPTKPPEKLLFIPANNSSTGAYQLLSDNNGSGLIFETEGDTLAYAFKSEHGNYSDGFRKAFHHETISYYRRTERELVDVESPCLSALLSGTTKQVSALIPDAENGLFSRFIFYSMNHQPVWKNVFASQTENGLDDYFKELGEEFYEFYKILIQSEPKHFILTEFQQEKFNQFFEKIQDNFLNLQGVEYVGTIRRLGLIAFRICMILSTLRIMETGENAIKIVCEQDDFQTALELVKVLVVHSKKVFNEIYQEKNLVPRKNKKQRFLEALPNNFNRQKYIEIANTLKINPKTAEGYITSFFKSGLVHREIQGNYVNTSIEDFEETKESED